MLHVKNKVFFKIKSQYIYLFLIAFIFSACARLNVYKIRYNQEKEIYEYPLPGMKPAALRTNKGELVTEDNFEQFIGELAQMDFRYPFDERIELAGSPKESDYKLASLYSESVSLIKKEEYEQASQTIEKLEKTYPRVLLYSDAAFLKGYLEEKRGQPEKAKIYYSAYNAFSSQKYSDRFREYRYADPNDTYWLQQKKYASDYIAGRSPIPNSEFLQEIKAKYYFTSFQPGYTFSDEGLAEHSKGIFSLSLGSDLSSNLSGGFQYYRNLAKGIDLNPEFSISKTMWEIRMAVPVQLYRSENNRFGIKLSPFGHYSKINSYIIDNVNTDMNVSVFNYGAKASMGFFIIQRLALGAYYTYNYYNANRPFSGNNHIPELWWDNEYDISLYVPLIKRLNLKGGIKSGDWVAGFYLPGWELSFNINEQDFILRTEMY
jgi:hypothetical protein